MTEQSFEVMSIDSEAPQFSSQQAQSRPGETRLSLGKTIGIFLALAALMGFAGIAVAATKHTDGQELTGAPGTPFKVFHYNILAKYLGNNKEPWFLYPLRLTDAQHAQIMVNHYLKNEDGTYAHAFDDGFGNVLTTDEIQTVRDYNVHFKWENRQPKILEEVRKADPDIISFVENDHFEDFQIVFTEYDGTFAKRPSRRHIDGSSIYWKRDRFAMVGAPRQVTFAEFQVATGKAARPDRVLVAVVLKDLIDGHVFVAVSVHLMKEPSPLHPENDQTRVMEVGQAMAEVSCLMTEHRAVGFLIMGDLNAIPQSYTHLFMTNGWQACKEQPFTVKSASASVEWSREGYCTSATLLRHVWIDYIFYSANTMELAENFDGSAMECPTEPMPNADHPSDHLPITASLRFSSSASSFVECGGSAVAHAASTGLSVKTGSASVTV